MYEQTMFSVAVICHHSLKSVYTDAPSLPCIPKYVPVNTTDRRESNQAGV